jgi:hypothetical protein
VRILKNPYCGSNNIRAEEFLKSVYSGDWYSWVSSPSLYKKAAFRWPLRREAVMLEGHYKGWNLLINRLNVAAEQHRVKMQMTAVGGALVVKLPWRTPAALRQLAAEIEQQSANTCQLCATPGASMLVYVPTKLVLTLCLDCLMTGKGRPRS